MSPELKSILEKMCEVVGAKYEDIDFEKEGWFNDYQWSQKTEEKFVKWLADYLLKHKKVYKYLTSITCTKINCKRVAESFTSNYGWKYADNKKRRLKQ